MERQQLNDYIDAKLKEANQLVNLNAMPVGLRQKMVNNASGAPDKAIAIACDILQQANLTSQPLTMKMSLAILANSSIPERRWRAAKEFISNTEKLCREKGVYYEHIGSGGKRHRLPSPTSDW